MRLDQYVRVVAHYFHYYKSKSGMALLLTLSAFTGILPPSGLF
jgi:hypothetical protein